MEVPNAAAAFSGGRAGAGAKIAGVEPAALRPLHKPLSGTLKTPS